MSPPEWGGLPVRKHGQHFQHSHGRGIESDGGAAFCGAAVYQKGGDVPLSVSPITEKVRILLFCRSFKCGVQF